jgi:3-methyladenine DNA glycosylase AlkC
MTHELDHRKPAKRIAEIPEEVLKTLHAGAIQSKNLAEWLAVDRLKVLDSIISERTHASLDVRQLSAAKRELGESTREVTALKQSMAMGNAISQHCRVGEELWKWMSTHTSDIVREWAAIVVGLDKQLTFSKKLVWIKPLADDDNAGLREIAWLALRADVAADPIAAIKSLVPWTGSRAERLRRYASEITRPRGVWTSHIPLLKEQPELGLPILQPLFSDDSKYVRDSVGNWLNDAAKSHPDWVTSLIQDWKTNSPTKETAAIAKRAMRSLG